MFGVETGREVEEDECMHAYMFMHTQLHTCIVLHTYKYIYAPA